MFAGTVSSIIFGAAAKSTPVANPNTNLPMQITVKLSYIARKQPSIIIKLKKRIGFLRLFTIIDPPTIEPIAVPRIEAAETIVFGASIPFEFSKLKCVCKSGHAALVAESAPPNSILLNPHVRVSDIR